ncbi:hypothetical protein MOE57_14370 [Bacillus inaquosorum]|uniref:hypothetical protein n=1 Tax=Bacillus inaquosorum TaxID=483913 RepID=UPI00227F849A|nr:hypothetical protein [Bacillus inaquosorum]MCY9083653.1 hypothetical protein [Bacillus inaquosorum]
MDMRVIINAINDSYYDEDQKTIAFEVEDDVIRIGEGYDQVSVRKEDFAKVAAILCE